MERVRQAALFLHTVRSWQISSSRRSTQNTCIPRSRSALLSANLGELEERSSIIEFALRQPLEEKVGAILAARPRVLALSVSIWNHGQTLELLSALSERWASPEKKRR